MILYPESVLENIISTLCSGDKEKYDTVMLALDAYPSVELPDKFGDLIDRDKLLNYNNYVYIEDGVSWEHDYEVIKVPTIKKAPVIIKNSKLLYWWEEPFKEENK